jgi:hypothetical protein
MRLSTSLNRNILEATAGGIINKFKIKSRRSTLFFEDILAGYVKECENAGHAEELEKIGEKWGALYSGGVMVPIFKTIPPVIFLNTIMKKVWVNLGLLDDLHAVKKGDIIVFETKNECTTRIIGESKFLPGIYKGALGTLFNSELITEKALQTKTSSSYVFKLTGGNLEIKTKEKIVYNKLNYLPPIEGFTLKDALKSGIFQLKENNRIFFRGTHLQTMENTLFHIIGNKKILLDRIQHISFSYFGKLVEKDSSPEKKLKLLKTLLHAMGWGTMKIIIEGQNSVTFKIGHLPYGFQIEEDNWEFLSRTILGYLWLINKELKIKKYTYESKNLTIVYAT